MDANLVRALSRTISSIVDTLIGEKPALGVAAESWRDELKADMAGVVGLAGPSPGLVAVHSDVASVRRLASCITGAPTPSDAEVRDTLCELANMVGGNIGMHLPARSPCVSSLPTVIEGENFYLRFLAGVERAVLPVEVAGARFVVELVLQPEKGSPPAS